jgi:hypothetical protein
LLSAFLIGKVSCIAVESKRQKAGHRVENPAASRIRYTIKTSDFPASILRFPSSILFSTNAGAEQADPRCSLHVVSVGFKMNILEEKPHVATKTLGPLDVLALKSGKRESDFS